MFNKVLRILIEILSIQSIFSLNPADLCKKSSLKCENMHKYQCTKDLCGLNSEICEKYYKHKSNFAFIFFNDLQKSIKACESYRKQLNDNHFCLKKSNCFNKQFVLFKHGYKAFNKRVDCKCKGKYAFNCNDIEYCTINSQYCDIIKLNIKYQMKLTNTNNIINCA